MSAIGNLILDIKEKVDSSLTPNNAATTGFLMAAPVATRSDPRVSSYGTIAAT